MFTFKKKEKKKRKKDRAKASNIKMNETCFVRIRFTNVLSDKINDRACVRLCTVRWYFDGC